MERITPRVSDTWRADEVWFKVRGNLKYLFAMMDDETRFWIAQEVADSKYLHDARRLLSVSKELMGKAPTTFITDGLPAYHRAFKKEFQNYRGDPKGVHIREITIRGRIHNNKMERMNGEFRDREKVMRGIKTANSPILKGYQLYHNYIRPHEALDGRTPADLAGIRVLGENKWETLIRNSAYPRTKPVESF